MSGLFDHTGRPIPQPPISRPRIFWTKHRLILASVFVPLFVGAIGIAYGVWQTRATRAVYNGPWVRFQFFVCTGPYNNSSETFQQLPAHALKRQASEEGFQKSPNDFVLKNSVFNNIALLEPSPGNDTVSWSNVDESSLDRLTGFKDASLTANNPLKRTPEEKTRKLEYYFEFFKAHPPSVRMMASVGAIPPWTKVMLRRDPSYDEPVDLIITPDSCGDGGIDATVYFRSVRTLHVRIENISPYTLTDVRMQLVERAGTRQIAFASRSDKKTLETASLPIRMLKPGEALVLPLSISLVPHLEASSYTFESQSAETKYWSQNEFDGTVVKIFGTGGQKTIELRPSYELQRVTFRVRGEDEIQEETRGISDRERLYVNNTCECGSCPLVFMRARSSTWVRTQEILSGARGLARSSDFEFQVPDGIEEVRLAENPGEYSSIRDITIISKLAGERGAQSLNLELPETRVTADHPLSIDIRRFRREGAALYVRGRGYYIPETDAICPFVFPLPRRWIESAMSAESGKIPLEAHRDLR